VALLDCPTLKLKQLVGELRKADIGQLYLFYKQREYDELCKRLELEQPRREGMTQAYKTLMGLLARRSQIELSAFLHDYEGIIGKNAVKIMNELGFITIKDDIIERSTVKRCQLEDSPLYARLQEQRKILEATYKENLYVSAYEILRG
jgi:ssDNA-specific exonuclease RecJ